MDVPAHDATFRARGANPSASRYHLLGGAIGGYSVNWDRRGLGGGTPTVAIQTPGQRSGSLLRPGAGNERMPKRMSPRLSIPEEAHVIHSAKLIRTPRADCYMPMTDCTPTWKDWLFPDWRR